MIVFVYMKNFGQRVPVKAMAQCHPFSLSIMRCSRFGSEVNSLVKQGGQVTVWNSLNYMKIMILVLIFSVNTYVKALLSPVPAFH